MRRLLAAIGFVLLLAPSVFAQQTKTKVGAKMGNLALLDASAQGFDLSPG